MGAEAADVTLTFPCDRRFVEILHATVSASVACLGQSEERGLAAAEAVTAFIEPDLAVPQAPPVVVEVTGRQARVSAGGRHLTVDF